MFAQLDCPLRPIGGNDRPDLRKRQDIFSIPARQIKCGGSALKIASCVLDHWNHVRGPEPLALCCGIGRVPCPFEDFASVHSASFSASIPQNMVNVSAKL